MKAKKPIIPIPAL